MFQNTDFNITGCNSPVNGYKKSIIFKNDTKSTSNEYR